MFGVFSIETNLNCVSTRADRFLFQLKWLTGSDQQLMSYKIKSL